MPVKAVLRAGLVFAALILLYTAGLAVRGIAGQGGGLSLDAFAALTLALLLAWAVSAVLHERPALFAGALAAAAFLACLTMALWADAWPSSDFEVMYSLALSLKNGDAARVWGSDYILRSPYQSLFVIYQSLIVSPVLGDFTALLIAGAVWMAGIAVLIYLIARQAYSGRTAGFLAMLYLLYPAPYFLAPVLTNQHISLFFLLLGLWVFLRTQDIKGGVIAGVLLALGNAFRPDGAVLILALLLLAPVVWLLHQKRPFWASVRRALPPLSAFAVSLLAGAFLSLLVTLSGVSGQGLRNTDPLWRLVVGLNAESGGTYSAAIRDEVSAAQDAEALRKLELEIIRRHLSADAGTMLEFLRGKNLYFWGSYEYTDWAFSQADGRAFPVTGQPVPEALETLKQTERLMFLAISLLGLLSCALLLPRGRRAGVLPVLCGLVFVLFFGVHLVSEVQTRYRYFVMPFLFLLAGTGVDWLLERKKPAGMTRA